MVSNGVTEDNRSKLKEGIRNPTVSTQYNIVTLNRISMRLGRFAFFFVNAIKTGGLRLCLKMVPRYVGTYRYMCFAKEMETAHDLHYGGFH